MICAECGDEYQWDKQRQKLGGLRTHCGDCAAETEVRYLGTMSGDGKQAGVQIHKFSSNEDRKAFNDFWYATSGMTGGKQCQMHYRRAEPNIKFETVAEFRGNTNHKGKAE